MFAVVICATAMLAISAARPPMSAQEMLALSMLAVVIWASAMVASEA